MVATSDRRRGDKVRTRSKPRYLCGHGLDLYTMQDPYLDRSASVSALNPAGEFEEMTMSRASHGIGVSKDRSGMT